MAILVAASMCAANIGATEEIIEVHGCGVGLDLIENGEAFHCIRHGGNDHSGGGNVGGGGHDNDGGAAGGGGGDGSGSATPADGWDGIDWKEQKRLLHCSQCKNAAMSCLKDADLAENTCTQNWAQQASSRCDVETKVHGGTDSTKTIWGCSINDLLLGHCTAAEGWWHDSSNWTYGCDPSQPAGSMCSGSGINNCRASWAQSHPGGSQTVVDSREISVTFKGVGGAASQVITATFNLTALSGYNQACSNLGDGLSSGCTTQQLACYAKYDCSEQDLQ